MPIIYYYTLNITNLMKALFRNSAHRLFFRFGLFLFLSIYTTGLHAQPLEVFAVSAMARVFEDGYKMPPAGDTLQLYGLRGETLSGQFAIKAVKNLKNVSVSIGDIKNYESEAVLSPETIQWNFVGSIPLQKNAPNQPPEVLVRPAPARFPDYLMTERQLDFKKDSYRGVWLTITLPEKTVAGLYTGNITVSSAQGKEKIPVSLTIYPLTLPTTRHLKVTEWYTTKDFERFHGIHEKYSDAWFDMLTKYAENMAEHRQNIFRIPMNTIGIKRTGSGELEFDYTIFDRMARVFWNTGKMDYLETGFLAEFGEKKWFSTKITFKDFTVEDEKSGKEITMPGEEVIPRLLPAFERHLRRLGWLDKTLFHIHDEPTIRNVMAWRNISQTIHKYAPDLVRFDAIETTYLFDDIEIAIPKLDHLDAWYETYEQAARCGTGLWFYTVGIYQAGTYPNKTIDMPVMDNRVMHWLNYKYDLTGYLHWGWNHWTEDPYKETGMHIGDGWHVYPVKDGVINSLRWEQMRNGIQDYECFLLLENKIRHLKDSLGSPFNWIDPKQRGKEIAGRVVRNLRDHTRDPEVLDEAKKTVIREILDFDTSPRIYIQTDPPVHGKLIRTDTFLAEVFGWTESGTKITINGEEIPVDGNGMFLWNVQMSTDNHILKIQAVKGPDRKEILRNFTIE